jgi:hypothetical protein
MLGLAVIIPLLGKGQSSFLPQEQEYAIAGSLPGDQTHPRLGLSGTGGYLVWQDSLADGNGLGISARRLNSTLSGEWGAFRVNERGDYEQENPQVAMLTNGGAVVVWQGGPPGFQDIYARFLAPEGTFVTGDILVNTYTNDDQIIPAVACLRDGNVVVTWTSYNQDGSMQGVYAQRLSPAGLKLGAEFPVTVTPVYNQRTPSVAALDNGNFAIAWVNEYISSMARSFTNWGTTNNVLATAQIHARLFNAAGVPQTGELLANSSVNPICTDPAIAGSVGGGFTVVWNQKDINNASNSWDICARSFNALGVTNGLPMVVNAFTYGDQYNPGIATLGNDQLVVWTSLGQDGSQEGVYGRFLTLGLPGSDEFRVNTTVVSRQMHPAVASDGVSRFLTVWSSFIGGVDSFDLFAQRYSGTPVFNGVPGVPFVSALSSNSLGVTWPELAGYVTLAAYELFMDGNPEPVATTLNNFCVVSNLAPQSTHTFSLDYLFADGSASLLSPSASGTTWGIDANGDGLPDDWQRRYWPNLGSKSWPTADSDHDGANNLQEFLAGTDPTDPNSVLRAQIDCTVSGSVLSWNTQPGFIYQVQRSENFQGWTNHGLARFAAGNTDMVPVAGQAGTEFYRVIRLR